VLSAVAQSTNVAKKGVDDELSPMTHMGTGPLSVVTVAETAAVLAAVEAAVEVCILCNVLHSDELRDRGIYPLWLQELHTVRVE